jgi:hypothetical protein
MDTTPPGKSTAREIVERTVEAALGSVPLAGAALAVTFVTAIGWRLEQRREEWFTRLAEHVEKLRGQIGDVDFENLAANDLFVDAVVTTTRTIEHTHQEEKIRALRNAVVNSVAAGAPDADTQAMFLNLLDRFTPSHLRLLALLDDPQGWLASHAIPAPEAGMAGRRPMIIEAGLPEMAGRPGFVDLLTSELGSAGLPVGSIGGMVSPAALYNPLTSDLGKQFLKFIADTSARPCCSWAAS